MTDETPGLVEELRTRAMNTSDPEERKFYDRLANTIESLHKERERLRRVRDGLLWLGNIIHNYGDDLFRDFLEAAIDDARSTLQGQETSRG